MAKKNTTQGWYTFKSGVTCWYNGLSGQEKKREERKYGKIVKFEPTNL